MRVAQLVRRDPELARLELGAVEPAAVVEHGVEPARGHVVADPLDDLPGLERLAERRDRPRPPLGADHVPLGTQLGAQLGDRPLGIVTGAVNPSDSQRHCWLPVNFPSGTMHPLRPDVYQYRVRPIGRNAEGPNGGFPRGTGLRAPESSPSTARSGLFPGMRSN